MAFPTPVFLLLLCLPALGLGHALDNQPTHRRRAGRDVPQQGFYNVTAGGGSMLTSIPVTFPSGLGEPINVILSGNSDAAVLVDQSNDGGLRNYFQSFSFSSECLGQHSGSDQLADLGDGNGYKNETAVIRYNYGDPSLGTCKETVQGGNHFRYWVQDGGQANSGAIFMALSYEEPISEQHDIIANGYNLARDWAIGNATGQVVDTSKVTNQSTYSGQTSANGYTYETSVQYVSGFLPNTSDGINHYLTVGVGVNAVDGLLAIMTAKIVDKPAGASSSSSAAHSILPRPWHTHLPAVVSLVGVAILASL